jgi:hypothetical protein
MPLPVLSLTRNEFADPTMQRGHLRHGFVWREAMRQARQPTILPTAARVTQTQRRRARRFIVAATSNAQYASHERDGQRPDVSQSAGPTMARARSTRERGFEPMDTPVQTSCHSLTPVD